MLPQVHSSKNTRLNAQSITSLPSLKASPSRDSIFKPNNVPVTSVVGNKLKTPYDRSGKQLATSMSLERLHTQIPSTQDFTSAELEQRSISTLENDATSRNRLNQNRKVTKTILQNHLNAENLSLDHNQSPNARFNNQKYQL